MKINLKLNKIRSPLILILVILVMSNILSIYYIQHLKNETKQNFFVQQRINRDQMNAKTLYTYKSIINDINTSEEAKKTISEKLKSLISASEAEAKIEVVLKSKGFDDSFASVIYEKAATIAIRNKNGKLSDKELKIIKETVLRFANIKDIEIIQKH